MMLTLIGKLLRDVRVALAIVALLLAAFQCLWAKVIERVLGQLEPFFFSLAGAGGLVPKDIENAVFQGPGQILRTLIGGEKITLDRAMDLMTVGYVHPLMQTVFCIWAMTRAAGAIAGEIDRGTMELLLAQPLARSRLILAHLGVDLVALPLLALSLWFGTWLGVTLVGPIQARSQEALKLPVRKPAIIFELGPFKMRTEDPFAGAPRTAEAAEAARRDRLAIKPGLFGRGLWVVGGLMFAVSGVTLWLSSLGRSRWRVLGLTFLFFLVQFLVNLFGQLWDVLAPLRPLTIFYYYQPQQVILSGDWCITLTEWHGGQTGPRVPMLAVLFGVGVVGYALALWTFRRRDLPAPL